MSEAIKDELATREEAEDLDELISMSIRLDNRLRERQRERGGRFSQPRGFTSRRSPPRVSSPPSGNSRELPATSEPEPMQIGRARAPLSTEERRRRLRSNSCFYCGKPGHFRNDCPQLSGNDQGSQSGGD